ncbi:MAG: hypothetical protein ACI9JN_002036 [Bacteroidia bacterium]|jgi:hypothetical protein
MNHYISRCVVFVLTITTSFQAYSQVSTFELKDYKLTDVRFQSYTNQLSFNQSGQTDNNMFNGNLLNRTNNLQANYFGQYTLYTNSRPAQRITSVKTEFVGYRQVYEFGDEGTRNRQYRRSYDWHTSIEVNDVHRKYLTPTLFLEAQVLAKYVFQQDFNYLKTWVPTESWKRIGTDNHLFSVGVPIKIGLGRLERVEDARQAIYLMQELQKVGRLSDSISQKDYLNLSAFVSKLRNKRFFDVRLQRIYQVKALDTFLRQNSLTRETDAAYFTTTVDYWMYGGNPVRQSGRRFALAFYPMMARENERNSEYGTDVSFVTTHKNSFQQAFVALEYEVEKPFKQKWQSNINAKLFIGKRVNTELTEYVVGELEDKFDLQSVQLKLNYGIGYFPTTRTSITWNTAIDLVRLQKSYETIGSWGSVDYEMDRTKLSSNLIATYYVSPRFRIAANLRVWLIRVPSFAYYQNRGFIEPIRVPNVNVANSYFTPDKLITTPSQMYNFEQSRLNTNMYLRVNYSLF